MAGYTIRQMEKPGQNRGYIDELYASYLDDPASVSEACRVFEPCPQVLKNVSYTNGSPLKNARVKKAIEAGELRLGDDGRLVIRESGTEPLIRVMAQGDDEQTIDEVVDEIIGVLEEVAV